MDAKSPFLAHLDAVVLDKTGTITVGRPVLAGVRSLTSRLANDLLRMAAGITGTTFVDDAQRDRVLAIALDGVRTNH